MRPLRGIFLMMTAVTIFTVMTALIKAAGRVPAGEAVFFRAVPTVVGLFVWLVFKGRLYEGLYTQNWRGHVLRGLAGSMAMGLSFAGLKYLPLPEVTALRFATPILIVLFAAVLLGERIRMIRVSAVAVGLIGVVVILWPRLTLEGSSRELFGAAIVLGSATLAAFAQIFVKSMAGKESTVAIVFYFSATASVLSLLTVPFGWVWPTGEEFALLLTAGAIGGFGQLILTTSYRHAEAGVLAPFTYISMLWAILIGWFFFAEVPTVPMLAGSSLIILAGVAIVLRERQLGLKRAAEAKVRARVMQ
ncbi:MAG: DMT family transporter [Rhodobacteraceae bacterium]|nr:DMT family transporter [Paracoccaceae bacterium]